LDYGKRYREVEAKINSLSVQKDIFTAAQKLIKKELASVEDQIDELTKELLDLIAVIRKN
jgi:phage-related tail protein